MAETREQLDQVRRNCTVAQHVLDSQKRAAKEVHGFSAHFDWPVKEAEYRLFVLDEVLRELQQRCDVLRTEAKRDKELIRGAASKVEVATQQTEAASSQGVVRAIDLAAHIAGPSYPWVSEAWRAEIAIAADGSGRPIGPRRQLLAAIRLILTTAPAMRVRKLRWNATSALCRFGRWCLSYDLATDILLGAGHVGLVELLHDQYGFLPALVVATGMALSAAAVIRRVRRARGE